MCRDYITRNEAMTILINEGIEFNIQNLSDSVNNDFSNATDLADYLVGKKVPFRNAYQVVGEIVKYCLERKYCLKILKLMNLKNFTPNSMKCFVDLEPHNVVKSRTSEGGTGFTQKRNKIGKKISFESQYFLQQGMLWSRI